MLALLRWAGEATPYELRGLLQQSVENFWPVPHTTFYAEPARLAAAGYLSERREAGGRRRKVYSLTRKGRRALDDWAASTEVQPPQLRDDAVLKVFVGADPEPIFTERREWHRAKQAELEGHLARVEEAGGPEPVRRALLGGIAYHRGLQRVVSEFLAAVGREAPS